MADILFYSANQEFMEDLKAQILRFLPDSSFVENTPDVIIVDEDETQRQKLRSAVPNIPVILLTSSVQSGGDNLDIVIKKPFSLMHFLDTLRAANNKLDNSEAGYLTFNNYELRPNKKEIEDLLSGKISKLTEKEVSIIRYLYKSPDRFVGKNELQKDVWGYNEDVATHTIETHIYRLRQKVEKDASRRLIITDNGGYKLKMD